jgi:hypothetical protein
MSNNYSMAKLNEAERGSDARVVQSPIQSGDGYSYGGATILAIGRFGIQFGEHPDVRALADEIARLWNEARARREAE